MPLETGGRANGKKHGRVAVRVFGGALTLLIVFCIVGSIVAALRAVSHESDYQREDANQAFGVVAEVTGSEDRNRDIPYGSQTFRANVLG
jgi:hypothetical protein